MASGQAVEIYSKIAEINPSTSWREEQQGRGGHRSMKSGGWDTAELSDLIKNKDEAVSLEQKAAWSRAWR